MRHFRIVALAMLAALQAVPSYADKFFTLVDSPERRQASAEALSACPRPKNNGPDATDNTWGTFSNASYGTKTPGYRCFQNFARGRWAASLADHSATMEDYRQSCAQQRDNLAEEMIKQWPGSPAGTKTEALGVLDFYFTLLGNDASAIRASADVARAAVGDINTKYPHPRAEYLLHACQADVRVRQLRG